MFVTFRLTKSKKIIFKMPYNVKMMMSVQDPCQLIPRVWHMAVGEGTFVSNYSKKCLSTRVFLPPRRRL